MPSDSALVIVLGILASTLYLLVLVMITVKRAHDINWSGAWCGLMLIPVAYIVFLIMLMIKDGTEGPNKYGEDPLGREASQIDNSEHHDAASYCPECKAQYREGFSICSDCGIALVRLSEES